VLLTQHLGRCVECSIFASLPKENKKWITGMKHMLEDEYVSYNVHLAPIFEYEAPIGVSLRGLGAGDLGAIFLKFCKLCGSPPNEVQKHTHT
jgi:hypothetical protein